VLEQQIDERVAAAMPGDREQQIGVALAEHRIDEAAGAAREAGPVERLGDRRGHHGAQRAARVLGLAVDRLEQRVVGRGQHRAAP
jgi:hypothetical protein